jgi:hypothetical protein
MPCVGRQGKKIDLLQLKIRIARLNQLEDSLASQMKLRVTPRI